MKHLSVESIKLTIGYLLTSSNSATIQSHFNTKTSLTKEVHLLGGFKVTNDQMFLLGWTD